MQIINCSTGPPGWSLSEQRVKPCSAGLVSTGDAAAGWGPPPKTDRGNKALSMARALPEGLCLVEEEDEGHYLTGSPRLFVRPVLVVADVPPLDLEGVGGGAAAAERTRHLHILTRLRRHVVGGLGEQSCCRQSEGCGCLQGHCTVPVKDNASGHTGRVTRVPGSFPGQTDPASTDRSLPSPASPFPVSPPQQSSLCPPRHFAKSSGGKGREQEPVVPSSHSIPQTPAPE